MKISTVFEYLLLIGLLCLVLLAGGMDAIAMPEQGILGSVTGAVSEGISMLAAQISKLLFGLILIITAAHIVIVQTTYWRKDNRSDGNDPFPKAVIREKVNRLGKWWGASLQTFFQPIIYAMMDYRLTPDDTGNWYTMDNFVYVLTSVAMVVLAWLITGLLSRFFYDHWLLYCIRKGKERTYKWLMVEHRKKPDPGCSDPDGTLVMNDPDKTLRRDG